MKQPIIISDAIFSDDKVHRYGLIRKWDAVKPMILFIGLNPSRADQVNDDATIRRCITFAQTWRYGEVTFKEIVDNGDGYKRYGGIYFANLFSFRTPYVSKVPAGDREGWKPLIENLSKAANEYTDKYLAEMIKNSKTTVCCWGSFEFTKERAKHVLGMISEPVCFGKNANGSPKHPLYLAATTLLQPYQ